MTGLLGSPGPACSTEKSPCKGAQPGNHDGLGGGVGVIRGGERASGSLVTRCERRVVRCFLRSTLQVIRCARVFAPPGDEGTLERWLVRNDEVVSAVVNMAGTRVARRPWARALFHVKRGGQGGGRTPLRPSERACVGRPFAESARRTWLGMASLSEGLRPALAPAVVGGPLPRGIPPAWGRLRRVGGGHGGRMESLGEGLGPV